MINNDFIRCLNRTKIKAKTLKHRGLYGEDGMPLPIMNQLKDN